LDADSVTQAQKSMANAAKHKERANSINACVFKRYPRVIFGATSINAQLRLGHAGRKRGKCKQAAARVAQKGLSQL
jgi:hypothetical protein